MPKMETNEEILARLRHLALERAEGDVKISLNLARARALLDAAPVPSEGRVLWPSAEHPLFEKVYEPVLPVGPYREAYKEAVYRFYWGL